MKLINPVTSLDQYVYHYTRTETALQFILKNGTLKFSTFDKVNDPREYKDWTFYPCIRHGIELEPAGWDAITKKVSEEIKSAAKLICFSRDKPPTDTKWQPEDLLARGFKKPSMWHHYAGAHDGVCLMFDRHKLNTAFKRQVGASILIGSPVSYSNSEILPDLTNDPFFIDLTAASSFDQLPNVISTIISAHRNRWMKRLFFTKILDWNNEEEYRWLLLNDDPNQCYLRFEDALEGIIVGERVPKDREEEFLKYCALYGAEIADLEWRNGFPIVSHTGQPWKTHRHLLSE